MNALVDMHTREFWNMAAAKAWKYSPTEFDALSEVDRGRIIAHERIARLYESHVSAVTRRVGEKKKVNPGKPDATYDRTFV